MKLTLLLSAFIIFPFFAAFAQEDKPENKPDAEPQHLTYCVKLKKGKPVLMQGKTEQTDDVTLSNGMTVKTDGTVLNIDGTQVQLKNGECIDSDGNTGKSKKQIKATEADEKNNPK